MNDSRLVIIDSSDDVHHEDWMLDSARGDSMAVTRVRNEFFDNGFVSIKIDNKFVSFSKYFVKRFFIERRTSK